MNNSIMVQWEKRNERSSLSGRIREVAFELDRIWRKIRNTAGTEWGEGFLGRRIIYKIVWPSKEAAYLENGRKFGILAV